MIQSDPGLSGIGAVIFDEFHERSLNADLGLALALEVRGRAARGPDPPCYVRDARRRAGGAPHGRAGDHLRRPRLPGRDALARPPAAEGPHARRGHRGRHPRCDGGDRGRRPRLPSRRRRRSAASRPRSPAGCLPAERDRPPALRRDGLRPRAPRSGPTRRPQDRPRHLHRRDLAHHRGHPRGDRRRPRPPRPLRSGLWHVPPRDRARDPGRGRPAPGPGGPGRSRAPATGSGLEERKARLPPTPCRDRGGGPHGPRARTRGLGRARPRRASRSSHPPNPGAFAEARGLLADLGALDGAAPSPRTAARWRPCRSTRASRTCSSAQAPRRRRSRRSCRTVTRCPAARRWT
jgi:ATP-dependent helicase HrpB